MLETVVLHNKRPRSEITAQSFDHRAYAANAWVVLRL